jgi:3,4-dihydroxy 2-butanone 4-phosphate synthase/GTP cyclohydrolase II
MTEEFQDAISSVEEIIEDARNGRMFILVDHEDRENEGDLVIPAQWATPDAINFMATHGRGLICLSMTSDRIDALGLPLMSTNNSSRHETAFTDVDRGARGGDDGHLGADRARTIAGGDRRVQGRRTSRRRGMSFRCARAMAACWCARAIPRRRSISRGWRG